MIFAKALGEALCKSLENDPRVVLMGEDIADPYGGAFKVTRGLSTAFPERVKTTPVSESAISGIAAGLALGGFRPIVEIMFGDFMTLCFDQLLNHISKYQAMYNGGATCPVIFRTPSGGHRGYGPTHSQSLEKYFVGVPHLRVVAASLHHDPHALFSSFLRDDIPTVYFEHKLLYPQHLALPQGGRVGDFEARVQGDTVCLSMVPPEDCALTVLSYGYEAQLVQQVIEKLAIEEELFCELLIPAQISPMDWAVVEQSVRKTGALLTVEEGTQGWSWGAQAALQINKRCFGKLNKPVEVLASAPTVIPGARHLEQQMLVGEAQIERAIREML